MRGVAHALNVPAPDRRTAAFWTPEEHARISADTQASALEGQSEELLRTITEFSDTVVQEIMVPRTDMVALRADATPEDVRRTVVEAGHSRIPVYEETIDNLAGLLYVKDLTASPPRDDDRFDLKTYVRKTFYVPEVMKISDLLREFQKRKTHLAIVVDEYGGTAGLVTLEDIIEEIVGEIQDEYDVEESQYRVIGENKIIADGRVSVWDLEETLGVEFPEGGYETLAGFLTAQAGYLPRKGDLVAWKSLRFTVKEANDKRIGMVEIERLPPETHAPRAG
jgi:CBS domain containing-hemolysin-like protein